MKPVSPPRFLVFAGVATVGCAVDLLTKHLVFARLGLPPASESWWLVDEVFGFTTNLNEGALFGFGSGRGFIFASLSMAAVVGIAYWLFVVDAARDLLLTVALGAVTGGILGNLYDRLGLPGLRWPEHSHHPAGESVYAVRDWIHFKIDDFVDWPLFNIADSLLVVGALLLVWHSWRSESTRLAQVPSGPKR